MFLGALFMFASMDALTKYLSTSYNVPLVVAMRYFVQFVVMWSLVAPVQSRRFMRAKQTGLVVIRAICIALASIFISLALHRMPQAEATAISFMGPMIVVLLAGPLLGERVGKLDWATTTLGFVGVLMIAHPGSGLDVVGVIFALCTMIMIAAYQLLSRFLARTEETITLLFYVALVGAVGFGIFLPWCWGGPVPTFWQVVFFLLTGLTSIIGHFLYTAAFQHASASLLVPMSYVQLVWAGLLGWLVFGNVPNLLSFLGMCVVVASGVALAVSHQRSHQEPIIEPKKFLKC